MKPTIKLRYVKRVVPAWNGMIGGPPCSKVIEVLQQWWAPFHVFSDGGGYQEVELKGGEWRDIPIEEEK